jgi:hypothetical protein
LIILDGCDNAIIADAVAPEPLEVPGRCVAEATRILATGNAFPQVTGDNGGLDFRRGVKQNFGLSPLSRTAMIRRSSRD